jgi:hypothetical protein
MVTWRKCRGTRLPRVDAPHPRAEARHGLLAQLWPRNPRVFEKLNAKLRILPRLSSPPVVFR